MKTCTMAQPLLRIANVLLKVQRMEGRAQRCGSRLDWQREGKTLLTVSLL